jgi:hypothetical protein
MKTERKRLLLAGTPSWALALLTLFGATIVLFGIAEGLGPYIKINEATGEAISYSLYGIIIAACCYFIVKRNPKSIWYVLLICNAFVILPAIIEPNFWLSVYMWIPMCGGLVLSIITSIIGARVGKRNAISDNP